MGFERFTLTGKSYRPRVSIRSNGQIGFTLGAIEKFKLSNFKFAVLFFDKAERRIGIGFTNDENEEGISKLQIRETNASISAKSFLDYYGINYSKTKRYDATWDGKERLVVVNLK